jgi:hypothetical protein
LVRSRALSSDVYQAQVRAAANIANVKCIDLSDRICGGETCEMEEGDVVVYRDSNHLAATYVAGLSSVLQEQLN